MSDKEIMTFEQLWQKIWAFIYEILQFFRNGGKKPEIPMGTTNIDLDPVKPIY